MQRRSTCVDMHTCFLCGVKAGRGRLPRWVRVRQRAAAPTLTSLYHLISKKKKKKKGAEELLKRHNAR